MPADTSNTEIIIQQLQTIESNATFSLNLPKVSSSNGKLYFVKLGSISQSEQLQGEAESLIAINIAAPRLAPKVLVYTFVQDINLSIFISEYKNISPLSGSSSQKLATRLARELHSYKSTEGFGFHVPTYCGVTRLKNGWFKTWEECYSSMISDLLEDMKINRGDEALYEKGQKVRNIVIPFLLRQLSIDPVLLHGDLWSGNAGTDSESQESVIFDPSSFYGHNEADLAIARIFGGFAESFFETYHEYQPKSEPVDQYELRVDLYELFHYLNHYLMFGGSGYSSSAVQKMDRLLRYCH